MADWKTTTAADVKPGDTVRYANQEFTVARVDSPFLGVDAMVCLIEDTPTRWHAYPATRDAAVEVQASA